MKTIKLLSTTVVLLFLSSMVVSAATYKWVDENGVVHFQDYVPNKVEPSTNIKKIEDYTPEHSAVKYENADARGAKTESYDGSILRELVKNSQKKEKNKVELYVTSWCPYCKKAINFFRSKGISFTAYDIEKDAEAARRKSRINAASGVPLAVINGKVILGFSKSAYLRALK